MTEKMQCARHIGDKFRRPNEDFDEYTWFTITYPV